MSSSKNFSLDRIGCTAILLVMVALPGITPNYMAGIKLVQLSVVIFFVFSGFLIGGILIKDFSRTGVNFPVTMNFWIRWWFRRSIWFTLNSALIALMLPYLEINFPGNNKTNFGLGKIELKCTF